MLLLEMFLAEGLPDIVDALRPYKGDPDIYISFQSDVGAASHSGNWWKQGVPKNRNVSGHKIGINPKTESLTTPAGIYAYPLREMWNAVVRDHLPFAGSREFVFVLRGKGLVDLSTYATTDFARDLNKLKPIIAQFNPDTKELTKEWIGLAEVKTPGGYIWSIVENLAEMISDRRAGYDPTNVTSRFKSEKSKPWVWNGLLRALGYSGFVDRKGEKIIHFIEPKQALFLSTEAFNVIEVVRNVRKVKNRFNESATLTEVNWKDTSRLIPLLQKNRGRWAHFTKVDKLGIHPTKSHRDPYGIYFYPTDWLIDAETERLTQGMQYGTTLPYLYLVDIDLTAQGGLVLSKVTWEQVAALAARNGWKEQFDQRASWKPPSYSKPDMAGAFLWHFLDDLNRTNQVPWNTALRGIPFIYDDGNAIIHSGEPAQIVVFDRSLIRNVEFFRNPDFRDEAEPKADPTYMDSRRAMTSILNIVREELGGTINFRTDPDVAQRPFNSEKPKAKYRGPSWPELSVEHRGKEFRLRFTKTRASDLGLWLKFRNGREVGDVKVAGYQDIRDLGVKDLAARAVRRIEEIAAYTNDLRFRPVISEEQGAAFAKAVLPDAETSTEILNDSEFMAITATHPFQIGKVACVARMSLIIQKDRFKPSLTVEINPRSFRDSVRFYATPRGLYTRDNPQEAMTDLLEEFADSVRRSAEIIGPSGYRWPKFYDYEWPAVLGCILLASGVTFDGALADAFRKEIEAWEATEDKRDFLRSMERTLNFNGAFQK